MNLSDILRNIFAHEIPPSPPPPKQLPDEGEIRWEKALLRSRINRARELQIEVDLDDNKRE